jgi:cell division transport system permease protein
MVDSISTKRVLKFGWINFRRSKESSWIIVLVIAAVIFLVSSIFLLKGLSGAVIDQVSQQVSIAAYFQRGVDLADISEVREELLLNFKDDIYEVKIVSAEEALSHFMDRYQGDALYQRALDQVGENPFLASLDIVVSRPERYGEISNYLVENHSSLLNKVDYHHRENLIDRVFEVTNKARLLGVIVSLFLVFLLILIAFSAIRVSIYASRWEIETMKLVGASSWFIRTPFIIQGLIGGLIAAILTGIIVFLLAYILSPQLETLVPGFYLWNYLIRNIIYLTGLQLATGLFLGWFSTTLAVHRHLKT